MKKLAWAVWICALVYNLYGTWVLGGGLVHIFTKVGIIPPSLRALRSDLLMAGPIITLVAMSWSLTWRIKTSHSN
jgi:hypothetical protein